MSTPALYAQQKHRCFAISSVASTAVALSRL